MFFYPNLLRWTTRLDGPGGPGPDWDAFLWFQWAKQGRYHLTCEESQWIFSALSVIKNTKDSTCGSLSGRDSEEGEGGFTLFLTPDRPDAPTVFKVFRRLGFQRPMIGQQITLTKSSVGAVYAYCMVVSLQKKNLRYHKNELTLQKHNIPGRAGRDHRDSDSRSSAEI
jgi:hypothetical protein